MKCRFRWPTLGSNTQSHQELLPAKKPPLNPSSYKILYIVASSPTPKQRHYPVSPALDPCRPIIAIDFYRQDRGLQSWLAILRERRLCVWREQLERGARLVSWVIWCGGMASIAVNGSTNEPTRGVAIGGKKPLNLNAIVANHELHASSAEAPRSKTTMYVCIATIYRPSRIESKSVH